MSDYAHIRRPWRYDCQMISNRSVFTLTAVAIIAATAAARAETFPVSGTWTYERANEAGAAKECGLRIMRFDGELRHDTGSGAPEYRNRSVAQTGTGTWRVVDDFYNMLQRGRVAYTLRVVDNDHIELQFEMGGRVSLLRRCS
jgi:hypothetical protein